MTAAIYPPYTLPEQRITNKHAQGLLLGRENVVVAGGFLRSGDYVAGVSGWQIDGEGDVEFNDGTFRGSIEGGTIDIGGATGFHVDSGGAMWIGGASFAAGRYSVGNDGTLTIVGGSTEMTIAGSTLQMEFRDLSHNRIGSIGVSAANHFEIETEILYVSVIGGADGSGDIVCNIIDCQEIQFQGDLFELGAADSAGAGYRLVRVPN